jgi:hypothetical protein
MKRYFLLIILLTIILHGCYMGKPLKNKATMYIDLSFETNVNNTFSNKYLDKLKWNDYKTAFVNGLKSEGGYYNLEVFENTSKKADFTLVIKSFDLSESSHSETVSDEKSPYNGKSFQLSDCEASSSFTLYAGNKEKQLGEWSTSANKSEKLTNNRNVGDYVFGTNKDNSEYRYKSLDDNICVDLSEKCGKHVIAKLTKKISKNMK